MQATMQKTYDLPDHDAIRVVFTFYKIDSWNEREHFYLEVDNNSNKVYK